MAAGNSKRFAVYAVSAVAASVALIAVSLSIVPSLTTSALSQGEEKRVVAFEQHYDYDLKKETWAARNLKLDDVKPDGSAVILNPFSADIDNFVRENVAGAGTDKVREFWARTEPYSHYNLVRLPALFGGQKDDISSFRAYSAVAISSGCLMRYYEDDSRWDMEDPCHSDRYRPWDGLAFAGAAAMGMTSPSVPSNAGPLALATLDLSVDKDGYITAKKPDLSANGSPGQGRRPSQDDISQSNAEMLAAASRGAGYALPFPASVSGNGLAVIKPAQVQWNMHITGDLRAFSALYPADYFTSSERIEISAYPTESYSDLALGNQTLVQDTVNGEPSGGYQLVKSRPELAGRYAILTITTTRDKDAPYAGGNAAGKLWGKASDGTDLFVTITSSGGGMTMDELALLARNLGLKPD